MNQTNKTIFSVPNSSELEQLTDYTKQWAITPE